MFELKLSGIQIIPIELFEINMDRPQIYLILPQS